jgi:riboflavin kinase/FMN adenylyltransferase
MDVIRGTEDLSGRFRYPVVALGNFDGVHLGHQALIKTVVERAGEKEGVGIVVTFDPHPLKILVPEKAPPLLTTLETKLRVLSGLGVEAVLCIPFTEAFSQQGPEDFVEEVLHRRIGAKEVVVGHNYAFGKGRRGNIAHLREMGQDLGFEVRVVESVNQQGLAVSSSRIRGHLKTGEVEQAAALLGRYYLVEGTVVSGHQRGKELGFPTANLTDIQEMLPGKGVYALQVVHAGQTQEAIGYIGSQPTFDGHEITLEVHLLDTALTLYGERLTVLFAAWIRAERRFEDRDALVVQIRRDIEEARRVFRRSEPVCFDRLGTNG